MTAGFDDLWDQTAPFDLVLKDCCVTGMNHTVSGTINHPLLNPMPQHITATLTIDSFDHKAEYTIQALACSFDRSLGCTATSRKTPSKEKAKGIRRILL
jgi:hypothetical protein